MMCQQNDHILAFLVIDLENLPKWGVYCISLKIYKLYCNMVVRGKVGTGEKKGEKTEKKQAKRCKKKEKKCLKL